jgi:hypothetical protein
LKEPSEHNEQVALVRKLRSMGIFVFAIPSGGLRDAITASRLKDEGAMPGIPDLCLILNNGLIVWLEMKKRKGGTVSPAQKLAHSRMIGLGQIVLVTKGAKDAMQQLEPYL